MTSTYSQNFAFEPPQPSGGSFAPFDADDFAARIIGLLPQAWFNDAAKAPGGNLWALVSGLSASDAEQYSRIAALRRSLRLATAGSLDDLEVISRDFFGDTLPPQTGESVESYRRRIGLRLFLPGGTREALRIGLRRLTGQEPVIIEPWNPGDCGAWDGPFGWDAAGVWGDLDLPWQGFVRTRRPATTLALDTPITGAWDGLAGWDGPPLHFADALQAQIPDNSVVYDTVNAVRPEGTTVWVQIRS